MRKLLALVLVLGLIVALSACTKGATTTAAPNPTQKDGTTVNVTGNASGTGGNTTAALITRDRAIEIALEAAGLTRDAVYDLEAELDRERGGVFWEVDFETRDYDYSYDIHSETGAITRTERERD